MSVRRDTNTLTEINRKSILSNIIESEKIKDFFLDIINSHFE